MSCQSSFYLVLVGGPIQGNSSPSNHPATYVDLAVNRLEKLGFHSTNLVKVNVPPEPAGLRTLATASEFRRWLDSSATQVCCVDVFTVGVHARKSWVLFRYVLGDHYRVGIISGSGDPDNRGKPWFLSAGAIWTVVRDLAGYVYAKLLVLSNPCLTLRSSQARMRPAGSTFPNQGCCCFRGGYFPFLCLLRGRSQEYRRNRTSRKTYCYSRRRWVM